MKKKNRKWRKNLLTSSGNWKLLTCCFSSSSQRNFQIQQLFRLLTPISPPLLILKFFQFSTRRKSFPLWPKERENLKVSFALFPQHTSHFMLFLRPTTWLSICSSVTHETTPPLFGVCNQSSIISLFNYLFRHCWSGDQRDDSKRIEETKKVFIFWSEQEKW